MSKRKQHTYPKMVKRRMVEDDLCSDSIFHCYLFVMTVAAVTSCVYLHICLLKLV